MNKLILVAFPKMKWRRCTPKVRVGLELATDEQLGSTHEPWKQYIDYESHIKEVEKWKRAARAVQDIQLITNGGRTNEQTTIGGPCFGYDT